MGYMPKQILAVADVKPVDSYLGGTFKPLFDGDRVETQTGCASTEP